ncbi:MAG: copper resistance protein B [Gammaproteobacteria bacterium]|nr:copper resistance protein B [Gammaproteobacteria bacterium]
MKTTIGLLAALALLAPGQVRAHGDDNPLLGKVMFDQLEWRDGAGDGALVWDGEAWLGRDLDKLWFKTEGRRSEGSTKEAEVQALYSRALAPFWDIQVGWRSDLQPKPNRNWLALGARGLAPYWFDTDVTLFADADGRTALRLKARYDLLFTQRLILAPDIEINLHGQDDRATDTGSGLSDVELGLRLRYEIRREFAPYVGVVGWRKFGNSADFARNQGERSDDLELVVGARFWF